MSATQASAVSAVLFQLMGTLDRYAQEAAQLTGARVDPEAYHRMRLHLDEMRHYAQNMPGLSASWVEVLIRHFELVHVRWRIEQGGEDPGRLVPVCADHDAAVQRMRSLCGVLLVGDTGPRGSSSWTS